MWLNSDKLVLFRKNGFSRKKVIVFQQKWLYSGKVVVIGQNCSFFVQKWLYFGNVVVFGQKWLYSGKSGCMRAKVVVFGQ